MATEMAWNQLATDLSCITPPHTVTNITGLKNRQVFLPHPILDCDGTRAETRFCLSPKRTSPFKSAWASVQSTTGSRGVRIISSSAGYTMFRGSVRILATQSIRHLPLHFPHRASPCAIRFQVDSTKTPTQCKTYAYTHPHFPCGQTDRLTDMAKLIDCFVRVPESES